jgi:hypothetical protein
MSVTKLWCQYPANIASMQVKERAGTVNDQREKLKQILKKD